MFCDQLFDSICYIFHLFWLFLCPYSSRELRPSDVAKELLIRSLIFIKGGLFWTLPRF